MKPTKEQRAEIKRMAHEYANPKTKVLQSYMRLHDAFEAGALAFIWLTADNQKAEYDVDFMLKFASFYRSWDFVDGVYTRFISGVGRQYAKDHQELISLLKKQDQTVIINPYPSIEEVFGKPSK